MESHGGFGFSDKNQTTKKKRSDRRPRNDVQPKNGNSSLSSSPPSDNASKRGLSDDNPGQKTLNLNQCNSRASYTNLPDGEISPNVDSESKNQECSDDKDNSEALASNYKDTKSDTPVSDGHNSGSLEVDSDAKGVDNAVKKVKLKVGGVTRTIHTKPSISKPPQHSSSSNRLKQKPNPQDNPEDKGIGLRGIPWKDFSRSGFSVGKVEPVNKGNKRAPKRRLVSNVDDEDEEDDAELRYLAKMRLKSTKVDEDDEGGSKKHRKISSVLKKSKTGGESGDTDYTGEERETSETFPEDSSRETTVTRRRRGVNSGSDSAAGVIEYPNGLPPAPPRKQKEKLSEVEYQLKKAEAAQRRKIQAAKAAQESEAEAIRKILGQDSSRKKRENKIKQRQEELAQERTSNAETLSSNTVRLVMRPTGTVVTFSDDIGLPNIFQSTPCSYPPPREKCAGPSCTNPFKYRDSKSKLPLCSLQCYKAIQHQSAVC